MSDRLFNIFACAVAGVLMSAASGCGEGPPPPPEPKSVRVSVEKVAPREVPSYIRATGTVEAMDAPTLSTKLMGRIEKIPVDVGDRVTKGQTLAVIEATDVRAQKSSAESAKAEGEAALVEAEAALANAETNLGRMKSLYGEGAVTKKELDDTLTHRDMMRAKVAQVKAKIEQAGSAVRQAESALGYSVVKSPVDGFVVARMMDPGDMASPGMPVLKVADTRNLRISATVKESESTELKKGLPCEVIVDALGIGIKGEVSEVVPVADPATRSMEVKVSVPPTEGLRPGMFVRVRVPSGSRRAVTVPESLIVTRESIDGVYIVIDGVVAFQPVRTGEVLDGSVEVVSGLSGGESLIVSDTAGLKDGMKAVAR